MRPFLINTIFPIGIFIFFLNACTPHNAKYPTAGDEIKSTIQESIALSSPQSIDSTDKALRNELLPPLTFPSPEKNLESVLPRFNVEAMDMPAKAFFEGLVDGTDKNIMIDPKISGQITLTLKNVTIDEALSAAESMYGYEYQKTSFGYQVFAPTLRTKTFSIDYLNVRRSGQSQTQLVSTEITNLAQTQNSTNPLIGAGAGNGQLSTTQGSGTTLITRVDNDFWADIKNTLNTLVGTDDGRWVSVNPQSGVVLVHAYPKEIKEVEQYLSTLQRHLKREVIIEAKILEITLADNYQAGIDWTLLMGAKQEGTNALSTDFAAGGEIFSLTLGPKSDQFNAVLNLLAQQGNVQVLSSPHIATMNNQEAVIKVGNDHFFVTGYTSNVTPSGTSSVTSQSLTFNPFFSGITLDVTPQIGKNDDVTLYIHPSISSVESQNTTIETGTTSDSSTSTVTLPLATSTIRESDNVVHAKNGEVVIIGGLMQNATSETIAGTPGLSKIPVAGALGRNTNQVAQKTELVILLRPVVIQEDTWKDELIKTKEAFDSLQRGFHLGGLPEDFGTQGERLK
jgi:MSHA biogenesis protein MshL